jgi:hypothetical protein
MHMHGRACSYVLPAAASTGCELPHWYRRQAWWHTQARTAACTSPTAAVQTTFIKSLLQREYPGCNIGPEPTTDRFTVVMHGYEDRQVPGNTLTVSPELPCESLHHACCSELAGRLSSSCASSSKYV